MSQEIITRANELINSKAEYRAGGMEGYAALSLIDENGYPSATTFCVTRADGINWLTFNTSTDRPYAGRISKNSKACVCINSSEYTINLVGRAEALTDMESKKDNWLPLMNDMPHWTGVDDPSLLIIRFTTERYTITFTNDDAYAAGKLTTTEEGSI